MLTRNRRLALIFLLTVLGTGVFVVYVPGLQGPFVFDDVPNLIDNPLVEVRVLDIEHLRDAAFSIGNRPYPHRGLARLSFGLNYYFAGQEFDAFAFKLTNVVIHVLNGLLVYWLSVLLLRRYAGVARPGAVAAGLRAMQTYLPLVVAALWLLHPIQLTSVLYVVQRMTSMAAFFTLVGLVVFVVGRMRLESGRGHGMTWMFAGLAGGVGLGFLCKQNAALLPFYAFLVELFFFRHEALSQALRRRLYGFYALTVALPAVLAVVGVVVAWDVIVEGYLFRDFTPWERLLTESRVLFFYLGLLVFPHIRAFGLYHDDMVLSTGLLDPWTTLVSVLAWVVLVGLALWGVRRRAMWSFGLLWYLVGHSMESSLLSLELVFEHRNYVPSFGVLFAATYYLVWGLERVTGTRRLVYPVVGLLVAVLAFTTFTRAGIWGDRHSIVEFSVRNHPNSSRAHGEYASFNAQRTGDTELAYNHWARAAELNRSSVLELIEMEKILAGQILALAEQGRDRSHESGQFAPPARYSAPMLPDLGYLEALDGLVAGEISDRLATRPIIMSNAAALRILERCIGTKVAPCLVLLPRAIDWHVLASSSSRVSDEARAVLHLRLAKLYALNGEIDKAVQSAEAAVDVDPVHVVYKFELAALYLTLGDLDSAERTLAAAEQRVGPSGIHRRILRDMKSDLERARAQANGAVAPTQ